MNTKQGSNRRATGPASSSRIASAGIYLGVALWLRLFDQSVQHFLCLLVQVGRRAVRYACGLA
jgi:hypothetical protein